MSRQTYFQWLARAGYAARGTVYVLVAALALLSTFAGGSEPDSKSALQLVLQQPLGHVWLGLIAAGLICFTLWRLVQSIGNADNQPGSLKGYGIRAAMLVSAFTYASLALFAGSTALRSGSDSGSSGEESLSAWLIGQPFGRPLLAIVALAVIGAGVAQIVKGVGRRYRKYIDIPPASSEIIELICAYGLAARGGVFLITGSFLAYAAFTIDPDQAGGLGEALGWVRGLPFGAVLYAVAAFGMLAFGLYGFVEARYRRISRPTSINQAMA